VVNWKLSAIAGGLGLVLSLLVGLLSGVGFSHAVLRALIFGGVFFGFGTGIWLLLKTFLPDLLVSGAAGKGEPEGDGDDMKPGSRINIAEDDKALPDVFKNLDHSEEVGDVGHLISGAYNSPEKPAPEAPGSEGQGVDQMPEDGYTGSSSQGDQVSEGGMGGLADLDALAGSFLSSSDEDSMDFGGQPEPERRPSGNKPQALEGDYNAKEMAAGIQTILRKDKE